MYIEIFSLSVNCRLSLGSHSHGSIMFVCAFVVAHVGNTDIQHTLLFKPNLIAHHHQPSCSFYCTSVSIPIYIRSARQH